MSRSRARLTRTSRGKGGGGGRPTPSTPPPPHGYGLDCTDMQSHLRSAPHRGLFFTVQRSTLKNHSQRRQSLPLVRYQRCASTGKIPFGTLRLSVVRNSEVFRYSGAENVFASTGITVGTSTEVRYTENVRYWEGPLSEVPLYHSLAI